MYTRHVIELTACTKIGCARSVPVIIFTAELPPQGVNPPGVRILGAKRAEVTWKEPLIKNGKILCYQIIVNAISRPTLHTIVLNATADQRLAEIFNLTAGVLYSFRLKTINGGGATTSSATFRRTKESSPENIPAPKIRGLSPYSIIVTILDPGLPNGNITRYELYKVVGPAEHLVLNGTEKVYNESGLEPYTQYYFRSKICTAKGCGSSVVGNGFTLEAAPNGSVILNVSLLNSTTAHAFWSSVHSPNGILYYNLVVQGLFLILGSSGYHVENDTRMVAWVQHPVGELTYTGLLPYTSFTFQINASNSVGFLLSNVVLRKTAQGGQ